jgi:glyoxylase-like metal-dependent hydrolase (beta-lactamase superfamily II)
LIEKNFGHIKVVRGEDDGRFPHCNTILVTDDTNAVIDPGAGERILRRLRADYSIDLVIDTHYHFDHIWFNHLFPDARIYLHKDDAACFKSLDDLAERLGISEVYGVEAVKKWKDRISRSGNQSMGLTPKNRHEWVLSTSRLDGEYEDGRIFDFGNTTAEAVHLPGHTAGFSCFYFPNERLAYSADIDLTDFGPWYGGTDGDIQGFLDSIERIAELKADVYVTGHEFGILRRSEFLKRIPEFRATIFERDKRIMEFLRARKKGATLTTIASKGLIYSPESLVDEWIYMWGKIMVKKHLERLETLGLVGLERSRYFVKKA